MPVIISGSGGITVPDGSSSAPSLRSANASSTGVFFDAANTLSIAISGNSALYVNNVGNVGVGTVSPNYALDVKGTINASAFLVNGTVASSMDYAYANAVGTGSNNYAVTVGAASNTWANTKLSNTSGISFNGSLYFPTGNIGIGRASATNPLDVYYTGADLQGGAFSVDAANSSLNTYHAFSLRIPATGSQRGFSIAKGIESFGFASFTNQINGANTPGFELGSGLAARDTKLYRTGAGILDIDNTIQVNTSISIGRNATAYALDVNGSINVSSGGAIAGGFTVASFNAGSNIASYGTWTPNPTNGNYQYVTSNGSVTIAVPTSNCAIDVLWYNGTAPGSVTFSGYQAASGGGGDSYLTTANYEYILSIRRINGLSTYVWKALQ